MRGHGAFFDHQFGFAGLGANLARHIINGRKVGITRFQWRRSHAYENGVRGAHGVAEIRREAQPAGPAGPLHDAVQARLVNWQAPGIQRSDPVQIVVGRDYFVSRLGKAAPRHQSHVSATNYS